MNSFSYIHAYIFDVARVSAGFSHEKRFVHARVCVSNPENLHPMQIARAPRDRNLDQALGKGCLSRAQPKAGLVTQSTILSSFTFYQNRFQSSEEHNLKNLEN